MQKKGKNVKKNAEMKKKTENAGSISKFMKKRAKCILNFGIQTKKNKKWKSKKSTCIWISLLLYPLCIFLHFKLKNSNKKKINI